MNLNQAVKFNRICILGATMLFTLALTGCAASSSSNNKKTNVKESKRTEKVSNTTVKNKSNFTVDDLKQHPKMSATPITLYGDTHVPSSRNEQLSRTDKSALEKGFNLTVETENPTTAKYYTNSDNISQFRYYSLLGNDHDQVAYYDKQDKTLVKVTLSDVISYLNKTLTDEEAKKIVGNISITAKNVSQNSDTQKDDSKSDNADGQFTYESPDNGKIGAIVTLDADKLYQKFWTYAPGDDGIQAVVTTYDYTQTNGGLNVNNMQHSKTYQYETLADMKAGNYYAESDNLSNTMKSDDQFSYINKGSDTLFLHYKNTDFDYNGVTLTKTKPQSIVDINDFENSQHRVPRRFADSKAFSKWINSNVAIPTGDLPTQDGGDMNIETVDKQQVHLVWWSKFAPSDGDDSDAVSYGLGDDNTIYKYYRLVQSGWSVDKGSTATLADRSSTLY